MITRYFILAAVLVWSVSGNLTSDAMAKTVRSWDDCLTKEPQRIKGPETLFPGGKIDCVRGFTLREDGTHEGSRYSVSYDGSGKIQGDRANRRAMKWFLSCVHDDIDDKHVCAILRSRFLHIGIDSEQRVYVSVGADHYPGSIVALKIDSNPPWKAPAETQWDSDATVEILEQLKTGEKVVVAYAEWPSESRNQETQSLWGFRQAFEVLRRVHRRVIMD